MARKLIKAAQVAAMVGKSAKTVKRMAESLETDFPRAVFIGGEYLWDAAEVARWIEAQFTARDRQWDEAREAVQV